MEKRLILIIVLGLMLRSVAFTNEYFLGSDDAYHHAMVIDYYKEYGFSRTIYPLDPCMERNISEPVGFYLLPTLLPFNSQISINASILLIYLFISVLFYFFAKKVNKKFALLAVLFLALSFANISKSNMWYYRGEHLIMPFILSSLLLISNPLLSGLIIGLSSFVWQGYPLAIVIYEITLIINLVVNFLKNKNSKLILKNFLLSNLMIMFLLCAKNLSAPSNYDLNIFITFFIASYFSFISLMIIKSAKSKFVNKKFLVILLLILISLFACFIFMINPDIFNLIKPEKDNFFFLINELEGFSINSRLLLVFNLYLLFPLGFFFFYKKDFFKLLSFAGFIVPLLVLFFAAQRFEYLASYAIILGFSYLFYYFRQKKNYLLFLILISSVLFSFTLIDISTIKPLINAEEIKFAGFLKNSSYNNSCIETLWDKAGIYQYFGLKTSTDSVAGQFRTERIIPFFEFLMNNKSYAFNNDSIIVLEQSFWTYIPYLAKLVNYSEPYFMDIITKKTGNIFAGSSALTYNISFDTMQFVVINDSFIYAAEKTYLQLDNSTKLFIPYSSPYPIIKGCLIIYSPNAGIFVSENLCNTRLAKLLLNHYDSEFNLIYSTYWVKAYKYLE